MAEEKISACVDEMDDRKSRHRTRQIEQGLLGLVKFTAKALHEWGATIFALATSATVMKILTRLLGLPFNRQSCELHA